jgi:hypothetical protein
MTTKITFDCALLTPAAIREMAALAESHRQDYDGASAAHYTAWNNLAAALLAEADEREQLDAAHEATKAIGRKHAAATGAKILAVHVHGREPEFMVTEDVVISADEDDDGETYLVADTGGDWSSDSGLTASEAADALADRRDHYQATGRSVRLEASSQILSWAG